MSVGFVEFVFGAWIVILELYWEFRMVISCF